MSQNKDSKSKKALIDSVLVVKCNPNPNLAITSLEDFKYKFVVSECFYDACKEKKQDISPFQSLLEEEYCFEFLDIEKLNKDEAKKLANGIAQSSEELKDHNVIKEIAFAKALGMDAIITENPGKYPKVDGLKICKPSEFYTDDKDSELQSSLRKQRKKIEEKQNERTRINQANQTKDSHSMEKKGLLLQRIGVGIGIIVVGGSYFFVDNLKEENQKLRDENSSLMQQNSHAQLTLLCSEPDLKSPESYPKLIPSDPQQFPQIIFLYQDDSVTSLRQAMHNCEEINERLENVFSNNDIVSIGFEWNQEGKLIVCGREKGDTYCHADKVILSIPLTGNLENDIEEVQNKLQCFNNDSCESIEPMKLYFTENIAF